MEGAALSSARRRWKHVPKPVVERGRADVRVGVVKRRHGPSDDLFLDRPNLSELRPADLAERDAAHKVRNLAAEYIRIEMTDDDRGDLRIGPIRISRRRTY